MATPRKRYFRVADSIRREPWDNDVLAMAIRLMSLLNERWARDGLTAEQAGSAIISAGELAACAGCQSLVRARSILRRLGEGTGLTWNARGTHTLVDWPKFATFQGLESEVGEIKGQKMPPPRPASRVPRPASLIGVSTVALAASKPAAVGIGKSEVRRVRTVRTPAPDALSDEEGAALVAWCREHKRPEIRAQASRLPDLVEACLTFHRGKGNLHASWLATAQTWVRNAADGTFAPRGQPLPVRSPHEPSALTESEREARRARAEERARAANQAALVRLGIPS